MKDKIKINAEAIRLRKRFGEDAVSPVDIFGQIASDKSLTITFFPMSERISGLAVRAGNARVIGINSTQTYGRQRFTAAHELYHLFYDKEFSINVCHADLTSGKNDREREADIFASFFLAPYFAFQNFIEENLDKGLQSIDLEDVIRIEQHFGLSRQATLFRLQSEGFLSRQKAETMKTGIIAGAKRLGFDSTLYQVTPPERQYMTYGRYVALAEKLHKSGLISTGRYEELLLDGFRADIVYGLDLEEERYD